MAPPFSFPSFHGDALLLHFLSIVDDAAADGGAKDDGATAVEGGLCGTANCLVVDVHANFLVVDVQLSPSPCLCFIVCCIGQRSSSGCVTSDTATANYFTSDVQLFLIPYGCVFFLLAPGPNHPSSTILISRPVYMQLFTTLMII